MEIGFNYIDNYYINGIKEAYNYFCKNETFLKKFKVKKENDGSYDNLGLFLKSLINFFEAIDKINYSDEYELISISKWKIVHILETPKFLYMLRN